MIAAIALFLLSPMGFAALIVTGLALLATGRHLQTTTPREGDR